MSGHSKWATTKRAKAAVDAKRASNFTRLANAITIAAREKGGDPETNFSLRLATEKAREGNMPKENIERAIKRGTGELEGIQLEEIQYEGYGPGGVAILIQTLTDNRNRTVSDIKHVLSKHGGSFGSAGSVAWMFEKKGTIGIHTKDLSDDRELELIEAGVEDIIRDTDEVTLLTSPDTLQAVKNILDGWHISIAFAEFDHIPKNKVALNDDAKGKLEKLLTSLEELDDIQNFYTTLL